MDNLAYSELSRFENLHRGFDRMGARLKLSRLTDRRALEMPYLIDIDSDRRGEYFDLRIADDEIQLNVAIVQPKERHLILQARGGWRRERGKGPKLNSPPEKLLCGHDERHWFVAGVPGNAMTVEQAKEALKPEEVQFIQRLRGLRSKERLARHNEVFLRQGEWFFVPAPELEVNQMMLLYNEPLSRGTGSKPHIVELAVRTAGNLVYICREYPRGLSAMRYEALIKNSPNKARLNWSTARINARVYARGKVRHPDHGTLELPFWHRVYMNREVSSKPIVFLD